MPPGAILHSRGLQALPDDILLDICTRLNNRDRYELELQPSNCCGWIVVPSVQPSPSICRGVGLQSFLARKSDAMRSGSNWGKPASVFRQSPSTPPSHGLSSWRHPWTSPQPRAKHRPWLRGSLGELRQSNSLPSTSPPSLLLEELWKFTLGGEGFSQPQEGCMVDKQPQYICGKVCGGVY